MPLFGLSKSVQKSQQWLIGALATVAAAAAAAQWMQHAPGALCLRGPQPGAVFDAGQAREDLVSFVGSPGVPRPVGSPEAKAARDRVAALFGALELPVDRQQLTLDGRAVSGPIAIENLIIRIPGTQHGEPQLAVVAHSDSVPGAPGASDDGAGVACALGIARALVAQPPAHPVLVVITDGEERGLWGARAFLAQHPAAQHLRAVVNLDARGAAGPAFIYQTGPETAWLAECIAQWVPAPRASSLCSFVYERMPNNSDFTPLVQAGLTGFNVAFIGDVGAYHTAEDTVERQSPATLAHMGTTALALVRGLDAAPTQAQPGRAVYGDVLGLWMVRWPEGWSLGLMLAGAGCVVATALWSALRQSAQAAAAPGASPAAGAHDAGARAPSTRAPNTRAPSTRAPGRLAARALLAAVAVCGAMAAVGWGFGAVARASGLNMVVAPGRLAAMDAVLLLAAVVATWLAGIVLRRWAVGPWSALLGAWVPWWALAGAAAVLVPAACFPVVVPVLGAGAGALAALAMGLVTGRAPSALLVAWAGVAGAAVIMLPLGPPLLDALGFELGWVHGMRAALVAVTLLPFMVGHHATSPGQGQGSEKRDWLGSNQQPSVS